LLDLAKETKYSGGFVRARMLDPAGNNTTKVFKVHKQQLIFDGEYCTVLTLHDFTKVFEATELKAKLSLQ
jgi:hypothetical protein